MLNYRFALNVAFTFIIGSISVYLLFHHEYVLNAILAVSYLLHWRKGIFVYFDHEHEKKLKFLYLLYFVIMLCVIIGSVYFTNMLVFFTSFSVAFLCALPALFIIKSKMGSEYKKRKIALDIVAFTGFLISAIGCALGLLDASLIILLNIIGHAFGILYIIKVKLYS
ncbi:MAG: hypothetical protein A2Y40_05090 [Candidatus Margulisbacteria bacterium GWF2_35_9]|nr:MAG: hypothetical protein A2Y40_05090 [Candidatus Margulisbacteria bacterium GWF2_35_9]